MERREDSRLYKMYANAKCTKYDHLADALYAQRDGKLLIHIPEINAYASFDPMAYCNFAEDVYEHGLAFSPKQIIVDGKQAFVFRCSVKAVCDAAEFASDHFSCNVYATKGGEITTDVQVESYTESKRKFDEMLDAMIRVDIVTADSVYHPELLNKYGVSFTLRTPHTLNLVANFADTCGAKQSLLGAAEKINEAVIWIKNNPREESEYLYYYYQRYKSVIDDCITSVSFGLLVNRTR